MAKLWTLLLIVFVVCLMFHETDAWRRRRRWIRWKRIVKNYAIGKAASALVGKRDVNAQDIAGNFVSGEVLEAFGKFQQMDEGEKVLACAGSEVCGGICSGDKCQWHCTSICNLISDNKVRLRLLEI